MRSDPGDMRALHFGVAPHRVVASLAAGRFRPAVRHGGAASPLRLRTLPRPELPDGWARIAPLLAGICASDLKILSITGMGTTITAKNPITLRGAVLGHEIMGEVLEASSASGLVEGQRVVAAPTVPCRHKGYAPCHRCQRGDPHQCMHFGDVGDLGGAVGFGFDRRFGGGWGEELVAAPEHVWAVPDDLDDRSAVLAEPTAIGVQSVLRDLPPPSSRLLVFGPGGIGLPLIGTLRTLVPDAHIVAVGIHPFSAPLARRAGADEVVLATGRELVEAVGEHLGTQVRGNRVSGPVLEDGFDVVYDTLGFTQTLDDGVRMLRPGGELVLIGTSNEQPMDWSLVWARELRLRGTQDYGLHDVPDGLAVKAGRRHAFEVALDVLTATRPGHLVTHVFPLEQPVEALGTASAGPAAEAVRVAFAPRQ